MKTKPRMAYERTEVWQGKMEPSVKTCRAMEDREREDETVEGETSAAATKGRRTRPRPQDNTVEGGPRAVDGVTDESNAEETPRNWRPVTANIIPPQNDCPRTKICCQILS